MLNVMLFLSILINIFLEHQETLHLIELTSLLLVYKSNNKPLLLEKTTKIKVIIRAMKSGGSKVLKEIAKESSKNVPKPVNTSSVTPNPNTAENPVNFSEQDKKQNKRPLSPNNNSLDDSSKKLANTSPTSLQNLTTLPTLSNLKETKYLSRTEQFAQSPGLQNQRDYRGVRLLDPLNTYYDNTAKDEQAPYHVRTHTNIQDNSGVLIGILTSGKNKKEGYEPQYISDTNFKSEKKTQLVALYSENQRFCEPDDLVEDKDATTFLKNKGIEKKIDAMVEQKKDKKLHIRKLINKSKMVNEDIPKEDSE